MDKLQRGSRVERLVYMLEGQITGGLVMTERWLPCEVVEVREDAVTVRYAERSGEMLEVVDRRQIRP